MPINSFAPIAGYFPLSQTGRSETSWNSWGKIERYFPVTQDQPRAEWLLPFSIPFLNLRYNWNVLKKSAKLTGLSKLNCKFRSRTNPTDQEVVLNIPVWTNWNRVFSNAFDACKTNLITARDRGFSKWNGNIQSHRSDPRWTWIFRSEQIETNLSIWLPTEISGIFVIMERKNLRNAHCSPSVFSNALAACKLNLITARDRVKKKKNALLACS